MTESHFYILQRASAIVMAPLVVVHVITILYAIRGGLSAEEILARTSDSLFWLVFYSVFVLAASIHAPLGLRKILTEWARLKRGLADSIALVIGLALLATGIRAVIAVTGVLL